MKIKYLFSFAYFIFYQNIQFDLNKTFFIALRYILDSMAVSKNKLLAPNGKMYTVSQLDKLNMKQVFDLLIKLGVADRAMYGDFKKINSRTKSRRRSKSRRRRKSRSRSRISYYETDDVFTWKPNRPLIPPAPPLPSVRKRAPMVKRKGGQCLGKQMYSCKSSPNCTWNGVACLNKTSSRAQPTSCVGRGKYACERDSDRCYWTGANCVTR